jgi:hypothetical protein
MRCSRSAFVNGLACAASTGKAAMAGGRAFSFSADAERAASDTAAAALAPRKPRRENSLIVFMTLRGKRKKIPLQSTRSTPRLLWRRKVAASTAPQMHPLD